MPRYDKANSLLSFYSDNYLLISLFDRPNVRVSLPTDTAAQFIWTRNSAIPGWSTSG